MPSQRNAKVAVAAIAVWVATWVGIQVYWSLARTFDDVELYEAVAMSRIRLVLQAPLGLLLVAILAWALRRELGMRSIKMLLSGWVAAAAMAALGDALGQHWCRAGEPQLGETCWRIAPLAIGPMVLIVVACLGPRESGPPDGGHQAA